MTIPHRTLGYVRVSSQEQARTGTSLQAQRDEITEYCRLKKLPEPQLFVEVESASGEAIEKRKELHKLMAETRTGDAVIVTRQDRWSRDVMFHLQSMQQITQKGARFVSIAENFDLGASEGRFASTIMSCVAEQERDRIFRRTVIRRRELRDQGFYIEGLPPVGYRRGKGYQKNILQVFPGEAELVTEMFRKYLNGDSINGITKWLQEEHGEVKRWGKKTVHVALMGRVYLGEVRTTDGSWMKAHEALVTRRVFDAVQEQLVKRRLSGRKPGAETWTSSWLLRGMSRCAVCGRKVGGAYGKPNAFGYTFYYVCNSRLRQEVERCSGSGYLNVIELDIAVTAEIKSRLDTLQREFVVAPTVKRFTDRRVAHLESESNKLTAKRDKVIELCTEGTITRTDLQRKLKELDEQRHQLDLRVEDLNTDAAHLEKRKTVAAELDTLRSGGFDTLDVPAKRVLLRRLSYEIKVQSLDPQLQISWHMAKDLVNLW